MTQTLSTVPMVVDVHHYSGDTLYLRVEVDAVAVGGRDWDAQVRRDRTAGDVDAIFEIVPGETDDVIFLMLPGDVVTGLVDAWGSPVRVKGKQMIRYTGVWDVQVSDGGRDPITTLAQGALLIDIDVTRRPS